MLYVQQNKKDGMQSVFRQQLDSFSLIVIWFLKIGFFYVALAVHWLYRLAWPLTQRSAYLCLLGTWIKGLLHYTPLTLCLRFCLFVFTKLFKYIIQKHGPTERVCIVLLFGAELYHLLAVL